MTAEPLRGLRVLDLTQVAVGPYTTLFLGAMGAEVLKVESARRADTSRGAIVPREHQLHLYPNRQPGDEPWNRKGDFVQRNRHKLGITLDLAVNEGRALFLRLAALTDVVVENFRATVLERLGLGYEELLAANPGIVYLKLSAQGNTGPERNYGSLGYTMECLGGLASLTGYTPDVPMMSNETYPDPVAGVLAVGAVMAALRRRRKTGAGALIDLSQREVTACLIGEAVLDYSMNGRVQGPMGNRHPSMAPHGVYPCKGDDAWVAIAVATDEEWRGLCRAIGQPEWTQDPRFGDTLSRWRHQDELDARVMEFTVHLRPGEVMAALQAEGVPAGAVLKGREAVQDPHLAARGWWDWNQYPLMGAPYAYIGLPWRMARSESAPPRAAPRLGEHNPYVYGDLLGLSQAAQERLRAAGVTGATPMWE